MRPEPKANFRFIGNSHFYHNELLFSDFSVNYQKSNEEMQRGKTMGGKNVLVSSLPNSVIPKMSLGQYMLNCLRENGTGVAFVCYTLHI